LLAGSLSEPVDQRPSHRARVSVVDPWRKQIAEWRRQGLSGVRMLELAREDLEQPYRGCESVWRAAVRRERRVREHAQAVDDVPIRFEGLPGEYLQVDWGEIRNFPFSQQPSVRRYATGLLPPAEWHIYAAMYALFDRGAQIDYHLIGDELRRQGTCDAAGGLVRLSAINLATPSAAYIEHYAEIVLEHAIRRRRISAHQKGAELAWDVRVPLEEGKERSEALVLGDGDQLGRRQALRRPSGPRARWSTWARARAAD
jgi:hypothetical protein